MKLFKEFKLNIKASICFVLILTIISMISLSLLYRFSSDFNAFYNLTSQFKTPFKILLLINQIDSFNTFNWFHSGFLFALLCGFIFTVQYSNSINQRLDPIITKVTRKKAFIHYNISFVLYSFLTILLSYLFVLLVNIKVNANIQMITLNYVVLFIWMNFWLELCLITHLWLDQKFNKIIYILLIFFLLVLYWYQSTGSKIANYLFIISYETIPTFHLYTFFTYLFLTLVLMLLNLYKFNHQDR